MKRQRGYVTAIEVILLSVLVLGVPLLIWAGVQGAREWRQFAQEHNCKVVAEVAPSTGTGISTTIGPNGHVGIGPTVVSIPGKTGYLCDDGITYWR